MSIVRFAEADAAGPIVFADPQTGMSCAVTARHGAVSLDLEAEQYTLLVMQRGQATVIDAAGTVSRIQAGEGITLPLGARYRWEQDADTVLYEARLGAPTAKPGSGEVVPVHPQALAAEMEPSAAPAESLLIGPIPEQAGRRCFADPTGQWTVGVWRSTPYHRKTMPFPKHEMMHLLAGSLSLTEPGAEPQTFCAGDTLLIPRGTICDWKTDGMWKIYCIFANRKPA